MIPDLINLHNFKCSQGYLKQLNYLSEFKTEYEKKRVRENLGFADCSNVNWGDVKGFILNQEDLITLLQNSIGTIKYENPNFPDLITVKDALDQLLTTGLEILLDKAKDFLMTTLLEDLNSQTDRKLDMLTKLYKKADSELKQELEEKIDLMFIANDSLLFKGVITNDDNYLIQNNIISSSGINSLPNYEGMNVEAGWTYKIGQDGIYAGLLAILGDSIICIKDHVCDGTLDTHTVKYWRVFKTNIEMLNVQQAILESESRIKGQVVYLTQEEYDNLEIDPDVEYNIYEE